MTDGSCNNCGIFSKSNCDGTEVVPSLPLTTLLLLAARLLRCSAHDPEWSNRLLARQGTWHYCVIEYRLNPLP